MKNTKRGEAVKITFPSDREIVATRIFDAPRDRVFKVFTDPRLVPEWWGPRKYKTDVIKAELKPGGAWRYVQRGEDGKEYTFHGEYREIVPPEKVVSTFEFEGEPGHVVIDTTTLEDLGGKTRFMQRSRFQTAKDRDQMLKEDMEAGMRESYERLDELLTKLSDELVITRIFDAPPELVWKAWTEQDRVKQ